MGGDPFGGVHRHAYVVRMGFFNDGLHNRLVLAGAGFCTRSVDVGDIPYLDKVGTMRQLFAHHLPAFVRCQRQAEGFVSAQSFEGLWFVRRNERPRHKNSRTERFVGPLSFQLKEIVGSTRIDNGGNPVGEVALQHVFHPGMDFRNFFLIGLPFPQIHGVRTGVKSAALEKMHMRIHESRHQKLSFSFYNLRPRRYLPTGCRDLRDAITVKYDRAIGQQFVFFHIYNGDMGDVGLRGKPLRDEKEEGKTFHISAG